MFNQIFRQSHAIKRQLNAPLLEERLRYLAYRSEQGMARAVLREIAFYQLIVIKQLRLKDTHRIVAFQEIVTAAKCWARHKKPRLKSGFCFLCARRFVKHARNWLRFSGRLESQKPPAIPSRIAEFIDHIRKEDNLSEATIHLFQKELLTFFKQIKEKPERFLMQLTPARLDAIQIQQLGQKTYSRKTIQGRNTVLRKFLRHAERQGWCHPGIADTIHSPRTYKHEGLPSSPHWEDVHRLLKTTEGDHPSNIRDRAIILLLLVYGLRSSEVQRLRLEDFDWENESFRLKHSKLGPIQHVPLVKSVGTALIRYLEKVRSKRSSYREIFLTLRAPFRPMNGFSKLVALRWEPLKVAIKHHGAHSLRHACATRLINQGVPLKTIADQLGHRNLETTRIYAKVDLPRLREVANFDLKGIL